MHHSRASLVLGLAIGVLASNLADGQTAPTGCTPDVTSVVNDGLSSVPDMSTATGKVAWNSTQAFTIAFTPQSGHDPYPGKKCTTAGGSTWCWSCALAAGMTDPIAYTITFTTSHKTINGRIIIKKK